MKLEITNDGLWASLCMELVPGLVDLGPEEATGTGQSDPSSREFHPLQLVSLSCMVQITAYVLHLIQHCIKKKKFPFLFEAQLLQIINIQ